MQKFILFFIAVFLYSSSGWSVLNVEHHTPSCVEQCLGKKVKCIEDCQNRVERCAMGVKSEVNPLPLGSTSESKMMHDKRGDRKAFDLKDYKYGPPLSYNSKNCESEKRSCDCEGVFSSCRENCKD